MWKRFRFGDNTLNISQDLWFLKWANHNQFSKAVDCGKKKGWEGSWEKVNEVEEEEEDKSKYLTKLEKQKVFLPNKTTQYK